ncbi:MAG: alpha/beta hydrolase [Spirulinaceae cyanobacterium SM2_1_0]|nr:alpha/beta hydrolase [Spirulinaceae cyanobacterium SM2_1_0]
MTGASYCHDLRCHCHCPARWPAPERLLVALHGWGANAEDLASLAAYLQLPSYQLLFPNAPLPHPHAPNGRAWYALEQEGYPGLAESRQQLLDWLRSLATTTGISLSHTVLAGFSQGGAMTLDVGLQLPCAALCSLSGYLHTPPVPQAQPPVLITHGRRDPVVPLAAAQQAREALVDLGLSVTYHEFDMGHEVTPPVLKTLREFLAAAVV